MGAAEHIRTISELYQAFGRGDVGAILAALTDDVVWATDTSSAAAPWYGERNGKDGVASFFEAFGSAMEVEEFTPLRLAGNDDSVLAVVRCRAKARATGKGIDMNHPLLLRFRGALIYSGNLGHGPDEAVL